MVHFDCLTGGSNLKFCQQVYTSLKKIVYLSKKKYLNKIKSIPTRIFPADEHTPSTNRNRKRTHILGISGCVWWFHKPNTIYIYCIWGMSERGWFSCIDYQRARQGACHV